jgi:hypothetical protein
MMARIFQCEVHNSKGELSQKALVEYKDNKAKLRELEKLVEAQKKIIVDDLNDGAFVEPGVLKASVRDQEVKRLNEKAIIEDGGHFLVLYSVDSEIQYSKKGVNRDSWVVEVLARELSVMKIKEFLENAKEWYPSRSVYLDVE